ncbi:MAG: FAD-dependent oxidoreductase [Lachnospiraceae bacterium]|nr:FAD-dependent oxidoreductase [Lachnospiraceae bacterium]
MESIWSKSVEIQDKQVCSSDKSVDVAVIGAGMAGILTAHLLKERGVEVIVIEADRIAGGQTKNTTAKITSQHGMRYENLLRKYGQEKARLYASANREAIDLYQDIIEKHEIVCDFERLPSYLYSMEDEEKLKKEAEAASRLGISAHFCKKTSLPFAVKGAVCFEEQAQFHPLKFLRRLAEELDIYEGSRVLSVKGHVILTNHGKIRAQNIIFTTHYPIINIPGYYFLRQHQERSYVVAYSGVEALNGMYYSADTEGLSYRSYQNILLAGGSAHRTGRNEMGGCYEAIRQEVKKYFPKAEETACWSAQDCVTHDELPFIGKYSLFRPYWYVITGFGKWGMTFSMIAASIIADEIAGKENPYACLFSPQRWNFVPAIKKFMVDLWESSVGLLWLRELLSTQKEADLKNGQGGVVRKGLKRYGCYKEEDGTIHRVSLRCPHMGCELGWNQDEQSWDCSCHGSRFDYNGNLIDNPAKWRIGK